ncbi:MAG: outer membrane protein assembly factor BamC [Methylobacter sp.]|nr:outer membrane protein assembly factor BamC [Methylobacter sp.]
MKAKISLVFIVAVLVNVSACTYIKNLFPDKEKDYQFTTEIPPLVLPSDLMNNSVAKVPSAAPVAETSVAADSIDEAINVEPSAPHSESDQDVDRKLMQLDLVDADQGTKRLRIGASSITAWRMVGKALSRNSIEVPNRNQEERLFHVQYDPNKQVVEDGSFWDELVFFFKGFETNEREYVLKLVENNQQTDVIIMDNQQQPVADQGGSRLLMLLHDAIKADLAK